MGLWVFQILFNFVLVAAAVGALIERRRLKNWERRLSALERGLNTSTEPRLAPANTPVPMISLNERPEKTSSERSGLEAFERANVLLQKGVDMREISRTTGLSLAELQLLGKVSQRNH